MTNKDKIANGLRSSIAFAKGDTADTRVTEYMVPEPGAPRVGQRKRTSPELNFDYEGLDVFLVHVQQAGLPGEGITLVMRRKGFAEWVLVGVRL